MEGDEAGAEYAVALQLLRQVPLPPPGETIRGATKAELAALEPELPAVYVRWLEVCNGSMAGPGGLFGVLDALAVLRRHTGWAARGWIPVAGDGNGNTYVLDASRRHIDSDAVFFVDSAEDDELAYLVASSLPTFLEFLLSNEIARTGWPFNAQVVLDADPGMTMVRDQNLLPWFR